MNLYPQELIEKMADSAWRAYAMAHAAVDALESAGLSVDGSSGTGNAGALFGAMTACCDAVRTAYGIRPNTPQSEELDRLAADAAGRYGITDRIPAEIRSRLYVLANKQDDPVRGSGRDAYEVTVAMAGAVAVRADSGKAAMEAVGAMPSEEIAMLACWDAPAATDADRRD